MTKVSRHLRICYPHGKATEDRTHEEANVSPKNDWATLASSNSVLARRDVLPFGKLVANLAITVSWEANLVWLKSRDLLQRVFLECLLFEIRSLSSLWTSKLESNPLAPQSGDAGSFSGERAPSFTSTARFSRTSFSSSMPDPILICFWVFVFHQLVRGLSVRTTHWHHTRRNWE